MIEVSLGRREVCLFYFDDIKYLGFQILHPLHSKLRGILIRENNMDARISIWAQPCHLSVNLRPSGLLWTHTF